MTRKVRTLGLAFVAVLAMSALGASVAQAGVSVLMSDQEKYHTTLDATQIGEHVFEVDTVEPLNDEVKCKKATFAGTLEKASSTITVIPTYAECKAFGLTATVTTTGCEYTIHSAVTVNAPHEYTAEVDVHCDVGKFIKVTTATCEVQVTEQTNLKHVMVTNDTNVKTELNDVTVTPTVSNIAYHVTKDGIGCPLTGVETRTDGIYTGNTTVTGTFEGNPIGITMEHQP